MLRQVYKIDHQGYFIADILIQEGEEVDYDYIEIRPPNGLYRAKWTGGEWVEDMVQEEIDELNSQSKEPSELEVLKQEKEALAQSVYSLTTIVELILTGGITE